MSKPKIIVWDVETSHIVTKQWSLWDKYTSIDNIVEDWYMICAAYKELGKKRVSAVSVLDDPARFELDHKDDYHVIEHMHEVLSGADAIIHHYGDAFDIKKFNARAIYHGFGPLPNIIQIDTKKIASAKFKFTSNKLDYLGEYLGVGRKIPTDNALWLRCEDGERKAIKEMVKYNKQDVQLLEDVYEILKPFAPARLNLNHFSSGMVCPTCGSEHLIRHKRRLTRAGAMIQVQCQDCGSYSSYPESKNGSRGMVR